MVVVCDGNQAPEPDRMISVVQIRLKGSRNKLQVYPDIAPVLETSLI